MQILPSATLSQYIKHYLFIRTDEKGPKCLRFFSDGNAGILFTLYGEFRDHFNESLAPVFLYGQASHFKDFSSVGSISLVIVVFQPNGIHDLFKIPGKELLDQVIDLEDIVGGKASRTLARLQEQSSRRDNANVLDEFFTTLRSTQGNNDHPLITASLDLISKSHGLISVKQLSDTTGYSERHIERIFLESIGLAPKQFGNTIRLHHFLKMSKQRQAHETLSSISYAAGYTDQSHLIKEFRRLTGLTPKKYLNSTEKLAVNLVRTL